MIARQSSCPDPTFHYDHVQLVSHCHPGHPQQVPAQKKKNQTQASNIIACRWRQCPLVISSPAACKSTVTASAMVLATTQHAPLCSLPATTKKRGVSEKKWTKSLEHPPTRSSRPHLLIREHHFDSTKLIAHQSAPLKSSEQTAPGGFELRDQYTWSIVSFQTCFWHID